jgi:hypothetical protein
MGGVKQGVLSSWQRPATNPRTVDGSIGNFFTGE